MKAEPVDGLRIDGSLSYLDFQYKTWQSAAAGTSSTIRARHAAVEGLGRRAVPQSTWAMPAR